MTRFCTAILICLSMTVTACTDESPTAEPANNAKPANLAKDHAASISDDEEIELASGPIVGRLRKQYSGRMAGLFYEREQRRIVVRLTGPESVSNEVHKIGNQQLEVVFVPGAAHSFSELNSIMTTRADVIQAKLPTAHARYVDERTGEIVIAVAKDVAVTTRMQRALSSELGAPVRIVPQDSVIVR